MGNIKIAAATPAQATGKTEEQTQKAQSVVGLHLDEVKSVLFGKTGSAILAGAAAGALVGGLPGAAIGGLVGLGLAAGCQGSSSAAVFSATVAVGATALAFPPVGALLVGASAFAFASGAAQSAASKLGEFLGRQPEKALAK